MNKSKLRSVPDRNRQGLILKYIYGIYCHSREMIQEHPQDIERVSQDRKKIEKIKSRLVKTLQVHLDSPRKEERLIWLNNVLFRMCCTPDTYLYDVIRKAVYYPRLENYISSEWKHSKILTLSKSNKNLSLTQTNA